MRFRDLNHALAAAACVFCISQNLRPRARGVVNSEILIPTLGAEQSFFLCFPRSVGINIPQFATPLAREAYFRLAGWLAGCLPACLPGWLGAGPGGPKMA